MNDAIQIKCTLDDVFGCFSGPQYFVPVATLVASIAYHYACGDALSHDDQTIVDLMLSGF